MPREEVTRWRQGTAQAKYYEERLQGAKAEKERAESLKKVVKSYDMPWENSRQGKIKHLANEKMNMRLYTIDAYIQELPPGGRSGKHRHMAEECLYILEGAGYDLHWDCEVEFKDTYIWKWASEPKRFDWREGDCVFIPVNSIHQHFNADPSKPARFVSAMNRVYKAVGWGDYEQVEDAPDYKP